MCLPLDTVEIKMFIFKRARDRDMEHGAAFCSDMLFVTNHRIAQAGGVLNRHGVIGKK